MRKSPNSRRLDDHISLALNKILLPEAKSCKISRSRGVNFAHLGRSWTSGTSLRIAY
jgi:hypothetical protein